MQLRIPLADPKTQHGRSKIGIVDKGIHIEDLWRSAEFGGDNSAGDEAEMAQLKAQVGTLTLTLTLTLR